MVNQGKVMSTLINLSKFAVAGQVLLYVVMLVELNLYKNPFKSQRVLLTFKTLQNLHEKLQCKNKSSVINNTASCQHALTITSLQGHG